MKKIDLINFENDIANTFNEGKIRAPVHLYSNNENFLINFQQNSFKAVYPPRFYAIMKKQKKDMNE